MPSLSHLDPAALMRVKSLELRARMIMEGFWKGLHRSPYHGFSVEFSEYRPYVRGDDPRFLDWKVMARTDRAYLKKFEDETNLRAHLLLDRSRSMTYGSGSYSKADYSATFSATLAYFLMGQQDAVGLVTFDEAIRTYLRPAAKPSQVRTVLEELARTVPGQDTRCAATFHEIAERIPSRGLVIIISDLFDDAEAIKNALHHFRFKNHELVVFHLMAEEELTFPFDKFDDFRCLEIEGRRLNIDPSTIRASYLERVKTHLKSIELTCGQMQADYVPINTKTPVSEALFTYFSQRKV